MQNSSRVYCMDQDRLLTWLQLLHGSGGPLLVHSLLPYAHQPDPGNRQKLTPEPETLFQTDPKTQTQTQCTWTHWGVYTSRTHCGGCRSGRGHRSDWITSDGDDKRDPKTLPLCTDPRAQKDKLSLLGNGSPQSSHYPRVTLARLFLC